MIMITNFTSKQTKSKIDLEVINIMVEKHVLNNIKIWKLNIFPWAKQSRRRRGRRHFSKIFQINSLSDHVHSLSLSLFFLSPSLSYHDYFW